MITVQSFTVNYFSENTYILHDETLEAVVIDCGCLFPKEEKKIYQYITENHLTLKHNLCTHMHLDHTCGNNFIYKTFGLRPEASRLDAEHVPNMNSQASMFNLPMQFEDIKIEHYLEEGERIAFGNSELTTILVPGHSPGSFVFYSSENRCLFSGDTLFAGSIGRTDLWDGGQMDTFVATIKEKILSLPDETIIYPGHGPKTTIATEKRSNPYLQIP